MVIQRIQSLFLLIAAILMAVAAFAVPMAQIDLGEGAIGSLYALHALPLLIIELLTALLLIIAIFLFKNLPFQIKVTRICVVLIVVSAIIEGYTLTPISESIAGISWIWSLLIMAGAFVFALLAIKGMNRDHKLLRSYDRLR